LDLLVLAAFGGAKDCIREAKALQSAPIKEFARAYDAEFRCFRHLKVWNTDVSQMSSNGFIVCGWTFLECDHGVDRSIPVQREVLD
jgi:hypothetical protein